MVKKYKYSSDYLISTRTHLHYLIIFVSDLIFAIGAGSNLKRVALGFFPIDPNNKESPKIRGVVALQKINKGDIIIEIPYEAAFNLGQESNDPTLPATMVLQEYCKWISSDATSQSLGAERKSRDLGPYLAVFPEFRSVDVLGSTDFFSDEALDALQYPPIVDETKKVRCT